MLRNVTSEKFIVAPGAEAQFTMAIGETERFAHCSLTPGFVTYGVL